MDFGDKPTPADWHAIQLADALFELIDARNALELEKSCAPTYTGQYSKEDYYAIEQERYNRAAEKYYSLVKS